MASRVRNQSSLDVSLLDVLKTKSKGAVAIFDKGDFYALYDEDAVLVAREVFRSEVGLKRIRIEEKSVNYISLGAGQYERVLRHILVILRYRVLLFAIRDGNWTLKCQGSIGNLDAFEEIGDLGKEATPIIAVRFAGPSKSLAKSAVASCDSCCLRISFAEIEEGVNLCQLEQCLLSSSARECLLLGVPPAEKLRKFKSILRRGNILLTQRPIPVLGIEKVTELLKEEYREKMLSLPEEVKSAVIAAVEFCGLSEPGWQGRFSLANYSTGRFLRLDTAAIRAFELFELSYHHGDSGTQGTLFSALNLCKTPGGTRLLREWLARPLLDMRLIHERQDVVEALCVSGEERGRLHGEWLPRVPDLSSLARRLLRRRARLMDCFRVAQALRTLRRIDSSLRLVMKAATQQAAAVKELLLIPICTGIVQFENFEVCVEQTIDREHFNQSGVMRIRPEIDPQLLELSERMEALQKRCERALEKMASRFGCSNAKLDMNSQHGYFYRVTMKEEKSLRASSASLHILDGGKGAGLRFRDDALNQLNDEYSQLSSLYSEAQKHLEESTVAVCASYAASLAQLSSFVSSVDVFVSLAVFAESAPLPHVRPELLPAGEGVFEIKAARHPVLDSLIHFIPNDIIMSDARSLVVTGANMGGKSTYLRSAALCALLAQLGARVPAESARLSLVDSILARVGAADSQSKGHSTFMAEMLECSAILQNATPNSLVIIDEIGRGTSTFDGFGLAWGITKDLIERVQCKLLLATHFTELTGLQCLAGVRAIQMAVHSSGNELALLYRVKEGTADASLGIHVARLVGISDGVLEKAREEFNRLDELEKKRAEFKEKMRAASDKDLRSLILSSPLS